MMKLSKLFRVTSAAVALLFLGVLSAPPAHAADYSFEASFTSTGCRDNVWQYTKDINGFNNEYIESSGSIGCGRADWYITGYPTNHECAWYVFVPSSYGNANVIPGLFDTSGKKFYGTTINENDYTDTLVFIGKFSNINHVNIGSNNGQTGTYIGLGTDGSLLAKCP